MVFKVSYPNGLMNKIRLNIRTKILLITTSALLALVVLLYLAVWVNLDENAVRLEENDIQQKIGQVSLVFDRRINDLGILVRDRAVSDALYRSVQNHDLTLKTELFNTESFKSWQISFVAVLDPNGSLLFANRYDDASTLAKELSPELTQWLNDHTGKLLSGSVRDSISGIASLSNESLMIAAHSILPEDGSGVSRGVLVIGRELTPTYVDSIAHEIGVSLQVRQVIGGVLLPEEQMVVDQFQKGAQTVVIPLNDHQVQGFALFPDLSGHSGLLIKLITPRQIYQEALKSRNYLLMAMILIMLFVLSGMILLLRRIVVDPLTQLNQDVKRIGADQDFSKRLKRYGQDELASLAGSIDGMLEALEKTSQRQRDVDMRYHTLVDQVQEGFALFDRNTLNFLDANPAFFGLLGRSDVDIKAIHLYDLVAPWGISRESLDENLSQGGLHHHETQISLPDGSIREIEVTCNQLLTDDHPTVYLFMRDLTQEHHLQEDLQYQLRSTLLLNRVIIAATAAKELKEIFSTICEEMAKAFDIPQAAITLLNSEKTGLDVFAEFAQAGRPSAQGVHIDLDQNEASAYVVEHAIPLVIANAQTDERVQGFNAAAKRRGTVTLLIVPLVVRGKVVGTLGLDAITQREFTPDEIALAQNVAATASQVLETTDLYAELRQKLEKQQEIDVVLEHRERILEAMVQVQRDLLQVNSQENIIQGVLATLGKVTGADRVIYYLTEHLPEGALSARRRGEWCLDDEGMFESREQFEWENSFLRFHPTLAEGELVNLTVDDLPPEEQSYWQKIDAQKALVFPVVSEGVFTGFFCFIRNQKDGGWDPADIAHLRVAAASIALAVERWHAEQVSGQIHQELQMQRDFALQVMTTMGQGLVVTTKEGLFEFVNPAFARMMKTKPEQLIGVQLDDVIEPDDCAILRKDYSSQKKGKVTNTEVRLLRPDGTILYVLLTGVPRWREDQIVGTIAVITDLTERRHTEDVLRKNEAKYRSVVESVKEVIFQTGVTGRWAFLNPAWTEITGQTVEDCIGINFFDYFHLSDREQVIEQFHLLVDLETPECQFEARILTKDDGYRWVDFYARCNLDVKGELLGISGTMADITERKQAEYALRKSEESIRALYSITSNQQMSFTQKVQALLVMGVQHFGTTTGILSQVDVDRYEVKEVFSQDGTVLRGDSLDLEKTYCSAVLESGEPLAIDWAGETKWAQHPSYRECAIESYLGAPVMVDGKPYGTLNFYSRDPHRDAFSNADLEFLRLMAQWVGGEIEQEQYTIQLQAFAAEISQKNKDLMEARDQALEASRLKSEFLATMSHEIRTPMNAVIGMTELLMDTPLNVEQADYAGIVRDSAQVLLALINDILDFSKIEAGKLSLESTPFELIRVVESAGELFSARVHEKGLALMELVSPEIPTWLAGDPVRLRQVLFNLVGNAVKFTERGEIRIDAEMVETGADTVTLRFAVSDTGIGLSETARKRLFQPFTQADGSTTRKYGGTGLGLAISKSLVTLMNGEIGVDSEDSQGSTFWFTARFFRTAAPESEPEMAAQQIDLTGLRVLVLDDHPFQREIFRRYLESWKMEVDEAEDAASALIQLKAAMEEEKPFHMALIDRVLPDGDGMALGTQIKADPMYGEPRLILVTAFDHRGMGEDALKQGFEAFILKPVKQALLKEALSNAVTGYDYGSVENFFRNELPQQADDSKAVNRGVVLLAEDNLVNQKLAAVQLEKLGFQAETVENGRQVLEALTAAPDRYCLVLMDCQMPEMDGFTATRLIRRMEQSTGEHISVVAMTANAMAGDREVCLAAGMDDYISKPVGMDQLRKVLDQCTKHTPITAETGGEVFQNARGDGVLDRKVLEEVRLLQREIDPNFLSGLIELYFKDSRKYLENIQTAVHEKDCNKLQRNAHSLKGSSVNLGARIFGVYCAEMEDCASQGDWSEATAWMDRLTGEYMRVCAALEEEKQK